MTRRQGPSRGGFRLLMLCAELPWGSCRPLRVFLLHEREICLKLIVRDEHNRSLRHTLYAVARKRDDNGAVALFRFLFQCLVLLRAMQNMWRGKLARGSIFQRPQTAHRGHSVKGLVGL